MRGVQSCTAIMTDFGDPEDGICGEGKWDCTLKLRPGSATYSDFTFCVYRQVRSSFGILISCGSEAADIPSAVLVSQKHAYWTLPDLEIQIDDSKYTIPGAFNSIARMKC